MESFPIYILLDTTEGHSRVIEAANKWIWELNSPISPGSNAKIISVNIDWNYRIKDVLFFAHKFDEETGTVAFTDIYETAEGCEQNAGKKGETVQLFAKRYGHIVLYLQEQK